MSLLNSWFFFFGGFLVFSIYSFMSSANSDSFASSFLDTSAFYFFPFSFFLASTSNIVLNQSGETKHPYLVSNLSGKAFSFPSLSMVLTMSLSYMAFNMLRYIPSIPILLRVFFKNHKWIFNFVRCFFCIY